MKLNHPTIRGAVLLLGALGFAGAIPTAAFAQTSGPGVQVNGTTVCNDPPNLSLTPNGFLTVTCTPVSTAGGVPACSVTSASILTGATQTITANCSNGPITSYAWTAVGTAPMPTTTPTGSSFSVTFPTAGSYQYQVVAVNATGSSNLSTGTITVSDPGVGGCAANATVNATWTNLISNQFTASILKDSYASFKLPPFALSGHTELFSAVNSGNPGTTTSGASLQAHFAISQCPGDFNVPTKCQAYGTPENAAIRLQARTGTADGIYCTLIVGQPYYLNVQNLNCTSTNCSEIVKMNGN